MGVILIINSIMHINNNLPTPKYSLRGSPNPKFRRDSLSSYLLETNNVMANEINSNAVTLRLLGFSAADKARFSSILTLAERGLKKNWKIISTMDADFFLVKEQLIPQLDEHEVLKRLPRQRCIFIRHQPEALPIGGHQLYWGEADVPSLRLLVEFLNQVSLQPLEPTPAPAATVEALFFDPGQGLVGQLLAPSTTARAFKLPAEHRDLTLLVDTDNKRYYANVSLEQLAPYFFAPDLTVAPLTADQLAGQIAAQNLSAQPLSHLLWFATFSCSLGKVIKGYQRGDIVQLRRWPDVNLPGCKRFIKLAAFMHSNAADLDTIHAKTTIPLEQIYNFYNACQVIGLIVKANAQELHDKPMDSEQKQLFARISRRLDQAT